MRYEQLINDRRAIEEGIEELRQDEIEFLSHYIPSMRIARKIVDSQFKEIFALTKYN